MGEVIYVPTMTMPCSAAICFGNAIFWKRSCWQFKSHIEILDSACIELESKANGCKILACSTKTAASYASEWDGQSTDEELLSPLRIISDALAHEATRCGARVVWCGDFGCDPLTLRKGLFVHGGGSGDRYGGSNMPRPLRANAELVPAHSTHLHGWQSAYAMALGKEPWTSASRYSAGKAVDYM